MTELEHGPEAFERVTKPYLPLLWRCARRLVYTRHEAEDLVQETCFKAFRAAIKSLHCALRKWLKARDVCPNVKSIMKLLHLALYNVAKRWTQPLRDWESGTASVCDPVR